LAKFAVADGPKGKKRLEPMETKCPVTLFQTATELSAPGSLFSIHAVSPGGSARGWFVSLWAPGPRCRMDSQALLCFIDMAEDSNSPSDCRWLVHMCNLLLSIGSPLSGQPTSIEPGLGDYLFG
jgi:hypothetical protein